MRAILDQKRLKHFIKSALFAALVFSSISSSAQVYPDASKSWGIYPRRVIPDLTLYFPAGCGIPTDSTFLFSLGFGHGEIKRLPAIYADTCGHHVYFWDPSLKAWHIADSSSGGTGLDTTAADIRYLKRGDSAANNTHGFTTQASRQKLADSLQAIFNAMLSLKLNSSDSAATNPHGFVTQASRQKLSDSLQAVFNALLAGKVTNAGGVSFFGRGTYASKPTSGTGIWYATDSASFFYINGATATNMNPTFHITVNNLSTGYPLAFGIDSTFNFWTLAPGSNVTFDTTTHGKLIINSTGGGGGSDSGFAVQILPNSSGVPLAKIISGGARFIRLDTLHTNPGALVTQQWRRALEDSLNLLIGGKTDTAVTDSILTKINKRAYFVTDSATGGLTLTYTTPVGISGDTAYHTKAIVIKSSDGSVAIDKTGTTDTTAAFDLRVAPVNIMGVISNRNSWTNTTGYTNNGAPTPTFTGNKLNFASGGSVYTSLDLDRYTVLEKFVISDTVVIGEKSGTSYGSGIGIHSYNTSAGSSQVDFVSRFVTYTAAGSGSIFMEAGPSRVNVGTSVPISFTVGDTIVERLERDGFAFTGSAQNLSIHGQPSSVTYIFKPTTDLAFMPNTGKFCIWYLGGAFQVTGMSITSKQPKNAKIGISGDSRGVGEIVTNQSARLGDQLGQNFLTVVSSGGFDRTADKLLTLPEDSALAFKQAIIWLGYNDINTGVSAATCEANLDSIAHYYTIQGMTPYFLLTSSDGAAASTRAINSYLRTHYPSNIFDCEQLTRNAGARQSDSVHLTDYGNYLLYNFITASGKLVGGTVYPGIRDQVATIQPAGLNIGGTPSAVVSQFSVGDGTDQTYQFRQWLGPNRDLWALSAFGTNYLQSLDDTHTNGTPLNIGAYRLSFGYQTTGYGEEEYMDSAGVHIGNPGLGIRIPLQIHVAVDTSLKFFTNSGEVNIEASDTTRAATSAIKIAAKYLRIDTSPTGGNEEARIGQGDTSIWQHRINYSHNIDGTLTQFSLVPRIYADSIAAAKGHDSTVMATKYDVDTAKAAIRASITSPASPILYSQTTAGTAVTNTITQTSIMTGTGTGSLTIPANSLSVGQVITLHGFAKVSTAPTSSLGFNILIGGTGYSAGTTPAASLTNIVYEFTLTFTVTATGASGSVYPTLKIEPAGNISAPTTVATGALTVNTTLGMAVDLQATWGAASTSDSIQTLPMFQLKVQ